MATWQFDVHLIPRRALQRVCGCIPRTLDRETFNAANWWQSVELPQDYRAMLSAFVPAGSSWSTEIELWGAMEGNRIEVVRDESLVESIQFRVDVAHLDKSFIDGVTQFAQTCDCLLFTEDKALIEPLPELLDEAALNSSATRFVANPYEFFDNLKANPIEP